MFDTEANKNTVFAKFEKLSERVDKLRAAGRTLKEGDTLSLDGSTGEVIFGSLDPHQQLSRSDL